jgi:hypothetical protein
MRGLLCLLIRIGIFTHNFLFSILLMVTATVNSLRWFISLSNKLCEVVQIGEITVSFLQRAGEHVVNHNVLAVLPSEDALAMHLVPLPFTLEVFAVGPVILATSTYLVFFKFSVIEGTVGESELASAVLLAILVLPLVFCAIWPRFHSPAMLLVIKPISVVISAICM